MLTPDQFAALLAIVNDPVSGAKAREKLMLFAKKAYAVQEVVERHQHLLRALKHEGGAYEELSDCLCDLWVGTSTLDGT